MVEDFFFGKKQTGLRDIRDYVPPPSPHAQPDIKNPQKLTEGGLLPEAPIDASAQDYNAPNAPVIPIQNTPTLSGNPAAAFGAPAADAATFQPVAPTFVPAAPEEAAYAPSSAPAADPVLNAIPSYSQMFGAKSPDAEVSVTPEPQAQIAAAPAFAAPAFAPKAPTFIAATSEPVTEPITAAPAFAEPEAPGFSGFNQPAPQETAFPAAEAPYAEPPTFASPEPEITSEVPSFAEPQIPQQETSAFPAYETPDTVTVSQEAGNAAVFDALPEETRLALGAVSYDTLTEGTKDVFDQYVEQSRTLSNAVKDTVDALSAIRAQETTSGVDKIEATALSVLLEQASLAAPQENVALQVGGYDLLRKLADTLPDSEAKDKLVQGATTLLEAGFIQPLSANAQAAVVASHAPPSEPFAQEYPSAPQLPVAEAFSAPGAEVAGQSAAAYQEQDGYAPASVTEGQSYAEQPAPELSAPAFDAPAFDAPAFDAPTFDTPFDTPATEAPAFAGQPYPAAETTEAPTFAEPTFAPRFTPQPDADSAPQFATTAQGQGYAAPQPAEASAQDYRHAERVETQRSEPHPQQATGFSL